MTEGTGGAGAAEPEVSVVVMAYNEAETIESVLAELVGVLAASGRSHELLIVDDGSTDATREAASRFAAGYRAARLVCHPENRGLGGVYRTGFSEARGRFLSFFPADGQFPAVILAEFLAVAEESDLVLGYLPERADRLGRWLSGMERLLYRAFLGPLPRFQGIFLVRRALLSAMPLVSRGRGWGIVMEMIVRARRGQARILSRPTSWRPRRSGASKVANLRNITANLQQLLTLWIRLRTSGRGAPGSQQGIAGQRLEPGQRADRS